MMYKGSHTQTEAQGGPGAHVPGSSPQPEYAVLTQVYAVPDTVQDRKTKTPVNNREYFSITSLNKHTVEVKKLKKFCIRIKTPLFVSFTESL